MKINRDKIVKTFQLIPFGAKGWMSSRILPCPYCGRSDKFGIILNDTGISSFNCFHASCGEHGSLIKLFKKIGRLDLLDFDVEVDVREKIESIFEDEKIDIEIPIIHPPIGFKRIYQDNYLDEERNWCKEDYKKNIVGYSNLAPFLRNYLIFLQRENGNIVGWLARSKKTKEWHKLNIKKAKEGLVSLVLRYRNSEGCDFERLLGGVDEIKSGDETVILVEGIMDKVGTDHYIRDAGLEKTKCCYTFGTNVSKTQALKLLLKGIKRVILMYDYGTIKKTQQYSLMLSNFFETKIVEIKDEGVDPGNMFYEDFENCLNNLKDPLNYKLDRLPEIELNV